MLEGEKGTAAPPDIRTMGGTPVALEIFAVASKSVLKVFLIAAVGCWVGLSLPGGVRLVTWTVPAVINRCF